MTTPITNRKINPMTQPRYLLATFAATVMIGCIIAANYVTSRFDMVWVFGLTATAGTYLAGVTFVARDELQRALGRRWPVLAVIAIGAALSFYWSRPEIALASGIAFAVSETADLAVWTPLEQRGYLRAAVASNTVGAVLDTFVFLAIAGYGFAGEIVAGQILGKLAVTGVVVLAVAGYRTRTRADREQRVLEPTP